MNDELQRQQAYLDALNTAAQTYGFNVAAVVETETLGAVVQCRGRLQIIAIPDWKPPVTQSTIVDTDKPNA